MSEGFDLAAYFQRIGYRGPPRADLTTLAGVHRRHVSAIAFENLDVLLGRGVELDLDSLQAKLIGRRRGGYCFEHNTLLQGALAALGFKVSGLAARVRWRASADGALGPRTHMLLKVDLTEGSYLADVGFGYRFDAPLQLLPGIEQRTPTGSYRLTEEQDALLLSTQLYGGWQPLYQFGLETQLAADYQVANWYTATHPRSPFRNMLLVQRLTAYARLQLHDRRFTVRRHDGEVTERSLANAAELAQVLEQEFDLAPPAPAAEIFSRLPRD